MMIPSVGTLSPELTSRTSSLMMFLKEIISIEPSFSPFSLLGFELSLVPLLLW